MRSGWNLAALFAGTALLLVTTRSLAAETTSAEAPAIQERVVDGVFEVEGSFDVAAPVSVVWSVLTDYDHIARFVSSMRRSSVRERSGAILLVEQYAVGRLLFFSREVRVLLELREEAPHHIQFKDVSGKDFSLYSGRWSVIEQPEGTRVVYRLTAKPKGRVPNFIGSSVFQASATELLEEVRTEIVRRAARKSCAQPQASNTDTPTEGKPSCTQ